MYTADKGPKIMLCEGNAKRLRKSGTLIQEKLIMPSVADLLLGSIGYIVLIIHHIRMKFQFIISHTCEIPVIMFELYCLLHQSSTQTSVVYIKYNTPHTYEIPVHHITYVWKYNTPHMYEIPVHHITYVWNSSLSC